MSISQTAAILLSLCCFHSGLWAESLFESLEVSQEHRVERSHVYLTKHYQFCSEQPFSPKLAETFAQIADSTYDSLTGLLPDYPTNAGRLRVCFYNSSEGFLRAGGFAGASGLYQPDLNRVLIRLPESPTEGYAPHAKIRSVLIHELTHQVLGRELGSIPPWLVEGIAVYMESVPSLDGSLQLDQIEFSQTGPIRKYEHGHIHTVQLETLLAMDSGEWNQHFGYNPYGVNRNYLTAYLLTYFLIHLDQTDTEAPLAEFLAVLRSNRPAAEKLHQLFCGRDARELELAMVAAYRELGFTLNPLEGYNLNTNKPI